MMYLDPEHPHRVLMLCYYYPPLRSSGTIRSLAFSRLLPQFGWTPVVLTVANPRPSWITVEQTPSEHEDCEVHRSTELNLFGLVNFLHGVCCRIARLFGRELQINYFAELLCIPDAEIAWLTTPRGLALAKSCELIYVSCSPFSASLSGCILKLLTGKPLVLDFRDAWTLNPHIKHARLHRAIISLLERFVLARCDALIVNTNGALRLYRQRYPEYQEKITAIPNGYDKLAIAPAQPEHKSFVIMHVGSFYSLRQPDLFLEALSELKLPDAEFVQVGPGCSAIEKYRSHLRIRTIKSVPHDEALELMKTASVLYLKQGHEQAADNYIAVAAKTYEYRASGLPIICDAPPGDNVDIVREYAAQCYIVTEPDKEKLKQAILDAYANRNRRQLKVTEKFAADFSRLTLSRKLADVFNRVVQPEAKNSSESETTQEHRRRAC